MFETIATSLARHSQEQSSLLFCDPLEAARNDAVERLHAATAIYTAEPVVDELLDRLDWPKGHQKLLDPSCGDGMFLVRALERLLERGTLSVHQPVKPDELVEGWEIHPGGCSDARNRVTAVLMRYGYKAAEAGEIAERMVINRDFLTEGPTTPVAHTIAGNPPYLRYAKVPSLLRDEYARVVPCYASGDLLDSFLERCSRTVHPGGKVGLVTSDRWLFNAGAAKLRSVLGERLSITHLERLDVTTAFYRPKHRKPGSPPRIHPVMVVFNVGSEGGMQISSKPIFPDVDESRYEGMLTLEQFAQVRIAPWLGSAGVFVVDAHTAKSLPSEYLVPCVDTDDIDGTTLMKPTRFAIRTFPDQEPPPVIMEHLMRNMNRMAARGRQGTIWMPPESFHTWNLDAPSLIVPRIAKVPKAVRVPAGVLAINHNLSVVCGDSAVLDAVEAAISSPLSARWVEEHAPRLENGYFSLVTTQLRKLPVEIPEHLLQ
ncbi:Eco57I restriction-modification methylase domain-containing protein [Paraburkholderia youngii]|uniref:Eco57I restriction-modification methylase domain-containing protein n=1 Tax=Paraburkholderia youngii TaxID=2782701 RepID=UPI003D1F6C1E